MLKIEASLPGFGGFYIDSLDRVIVYVKSSSTVSRGEIQRVLKDFYATWPNPRERAIMAAAATAEVSAGEYSLSELIAVENRISSVLLSTPGIVGVGTSLRQNRVIVGFRDQGIKEQGVAFLELHGVPRGAIKPEIWGDVAVTATFSDRIRNTRAGIEIGVGLRQDPTNPTVYRSFGGSHGFTVTKSDGTKYFMTAAHIANNLWGQNGKTGDDVYQPRWEPIINNKIGTIAVSVPWLEQTSCPIDSLSGAYPDFCTRSDVALVALSGADAEKKVATSTREGQNGSAGTLTINGYYSIQAVLSPEYVKYQTNKGVHKSGFKTGTTTGVIDPPLTRVVQPFMPWGMYYPGQQPWVTRSIIYYDVTRVVHAGWGSGDSGGAVFAGNGSPYDALGIEVAGGGQQQNGICTSGTACAFYFTRWDKIEQELGFSINPITGQ